MVGAVVVFVPMANAPVLHVPAEQALGERLEMIPIDVICTAIRSGQPIGGADHVTAWSDGKNYLVTGWRFDGAVPVFSWTGAGTPEHDPGCVPGRGK